MWVLYLDTPREKSKVNGAAVGQYSAWLAFFHWLAFLCNDFSLEAAIMLSAQKQRFSFMAEIPKKYNWTRAQHKHSPTFLFGSWCSHWHSFGPRQPALPQIMNAQAQGAARITDCSHSSGRTKCWEKVQTPICEPGWATQPQHLRPIPGLGWF